MKNKGRILINILIIFIVLGIVLYISLKDNYEEIISYILRMDIKWIILGIFGIIMYRCLVGLSSYLVVGANGRKIGLLKSIQINFIILFFHGVTPFAGGGQPMEIYYLHKEKIPVGSATNIVLQNFILYQVALILVEIMAIIYNSYFKLFPRDSIIRRLVIIGFLVNILVLVISIILSFGKKFNKFILNKGINFLGKIRVIKDVDKIRGKLEEYINNFYQNTKILKKNKAVVFKAVIINVLALFSLYSIPYSVSHGLGVNNLSLIEAIVTTAYVMVMGSFVPIPGGTGGLEYGFMCFFGYLIKGRVLTAIMLVWRAISYYLGTIIGAINLAFYRKKE